MKKLIAIIMCLCVALSLAACSTAPTQEELEQSVADMKSDIDSQDIVAVNARVFTDGNNDKWLMSDIKNETAEGVYIGSLVIAFLAWDGNGAPVQIKTEENPENPYYCFEMTVGKSVAILKGATWTADIGLKLSEACDDIAYVEAIAVSGTINVEAWENPCYDAWYELYNGQILADWQREDMKSFATDYITEDSAEETEQDPKQRFDQMKADIKNQNAYITASSVYKNTETGDIFLTANIKNDSDKSISNIDIAFAAWDIDGNPILIKSASGLTEDSYIKELNFGDVTLSAGEEWIGDTEDNVYGLRVNSEQTNIAYVEAIFVGYVADDGGVWTNPAYYTWKNVFGGQMLCDWMKNG